MYLPVKTQRGVEFSRSVENQLSFEDLLEKARSLPDWECIVVSETNGEREYVIYRIFGGTDISVFLVPEQAELKKGKLKHYRISNGVYPKLKFVVVTGTYNSAIEDLPKLQKFLHLAMQSWS